MNEFELIRRYFAPLGPPDESVHLGIGDDCALIELPAGSELAVTTDTLVADVHFPKDTTPADIGWKSLAVNLSDLAAMGAEARWFTLALTLPEKNENWLRGFAEGLGQLALEANVSLVGGDTTRGPLSITITAMGAVPAGAALRRSGAKAGDAVCVTGTLGDAALGLRLLNERGGGIPFLVDRLNRPTPRLPAGRALRGIAHAAIDLSDGLAGDLAHVLSASGVGAEIECDLLPASPAFLQLAPPQERLALQLAGGDDYELCLCLPRERLQEARALLDVPLTQIGVVTLDEGLRFLDASGTIVPIDAQGYRHF